MIERDASEQGSSIPPTDVGSTSTSPPPVSSSPVGRSSAVAGEPSPAPAVTPRVTPGRTTKYVFVTGGVSSALGKGITAASLARLLKARGLRVMLQKLDPYINVDPGTMNPYEHGEVFVTDDGGETDLDLGHYERFLDESLHRGCSVSSGQIWQAVIDKERRGDYLGKTVQVIPHITNEIKDRIHAVGRDAPGEPVDVVITEVGGTVGDIEGLPFLEAIRQLRHDVGRDNILYLHVALVPYISAAGELKTKPAQHSIRELRSIGIHPDVLVLRADRPITSDLKDKIARQSDVDPDAVIASVDADSLYEVPMLMREEGLDEVVARHLRLPDTEPDLRAWRDLLARQDRATDTVTIAIVGKYVELPDAYLSVAEALRHAGIAVGVNVEIDWIRSEEVTAENVRDRLRNADGIIVPGGFGVRGIAGKIEATRLARERQLPWLGLCLGMHVATIEFARNVLGLADANSYEFDPHTPHPVIALMPDQADITDKGGTMRLGTYPARLEPGSVTSRAYDGAETVHERHRHRYEFNNAYRERFASAGMRFSGRSPDDRLVEFIELADHPFFVATQAHPELKSRPIRPHPLFVGLVRAASQRHAASTGRLPIELDEPTVGEVEHATRFEPVPAPSDGRPSDRPSDGHEGRHDGARPDGGHDDEPDGRVDGAADRAARMAGR